MTRRVLGAQLRLIQRREPITADWLNKVAATAERNAKAIDELNTEKPEGEDGEGSAETKTYAERLADRETTLVRIEDANDPANVYIEINRIDRIVFVNTKDPGDVLDLTLDWS